VARPPRAFISWSSGKDSAFALHEARRCGLAEIVGALTTLNEAYGRVAMHGVRDSVLDRQIAALGLPVLKVQLPDPCTNQAYEERMAQAFERMKSQGVTHLVFGDLFLEDIRAYREKQLAAAGMTGIFPLWRRDTAALARDMIASGLTAHLVCVDPRHLSREFAGRQERRHRATQDAGHPRYGSARSDRYGAVPYRTFAPKFDLAPQIWGAKV